MVPRAPSERFPATFSIPLNAAGLTALQGSVGNGDFRIGARYGMGAGLITPCAASERAQLEVTFQN